MATQNGYILWQGKSLLDNAPIIVIATGFAKSKNRKTGQMIQVWIIRRDINPLEAVRKGKDASICGNCKHRPTTAANPNGWGTCYVHLPQAPTGVYRAYKNGSYRPIEHADWAILFKDRRVRFGAYGDPAAVPTEIWQRIADNCDHHTGYTHQWQTCDQNLQSLLMASVDTPEEYERAQAMGWRTFRVRMPDEELDATERVCPASEEAGKKATCATCMACHGGGNKRASIAIEAHGGTWKPKRFIQIRVLQKQHKAYRPILQEAIKNRVPKDRYIRNGFLIEVIRDAKGNPIQNKYTPVKPKKPVGCM